MTVASAENVRPTLVYFDQWTDPVAEEILAAAGSVDVERLSIVGDEAAVWHGLEHAHGYQSLIRTELARRPGADQWIATAALLERCNRLLAVCSAGAGYDIIDVDACTEAGVIVCNNSGPGREAVAEHALGFMLALGKKIVAGDRLIRRAVVQDRAPLRGIELQGRTVGIVGLGQIGSRLAELANAFGMQVIAYDPVLSDDDVRSRGAERVDLDELLARSDFLQLTCPLTPETEGLIGRRELSLMQPGAYFISTARGPVHDEVALHEALVEGRIAGAGLDVFHDEPPSPDHPLLQLDNVIATPHVAGITEEATRHIAVATAEQWLAIFRGEVPPRLLNPEAWPLYMKRFEEQLGRRPEDLPERTR